MSKKYFNNKYKRTKKQVAAKSAKTQLEYICSCCKSTFKSQKRFIKLGKDYTSYCSTHRKICYMCLCRHGQQGDTCSSYCSNNYRKLRWAWKEKYGSNYKKLENKLKQFKLEAIELEVLKKVYGINSKDIQNRSQAIYNAMLRLQDTYQLSNRGDKLFLLDNVYWIVKKSFYIYRDQYNFKKIESLEINN